MYIFRMTTTKFIGYQFYSRLDLLEVKINNFKSFTLG